MNISHEWTKISIAISDLVYQAKYQHNCVFYQDRLLQYIRIADTNTLIDAQKRLKNKRNPEVKRIVYALLGLNQSRRVHVIRKAILDLSPAFPKEVADLENKLECLLSTKNKHRQQIVKLYKYLKRIDGAINDGRYDLVLRLANRCLKEYYSYFLNLKFPSCEELKKGETNIMSIKIVHYIIRYLEQKGIPYSTSKVITITLFSNMLSTANQSVPSVKAPVTIDKAIAVYTRENLNLIIRFINRFI